METPMQKTGEIVVLVEDSGARQTLYKESVLLFPQPLQNQGCTAVSPPAIPLHDRGVTAFQSHLSVRLVAIFCEAKVASEFIWLGLVQHFISPISVPQLVKQKTCSGISSCYLIQEASCISTKKCNRKVDTQLSY